MSVLEYLSLLLSLCHCYFVFVTVDLSLLLCHCRFVALSLLFYCYRFLLPLLRRHLVTIPNVTVILSLRFVAVFWYCRFVSVALSLLFGSFRFFNVVVSLSFFILSLSFCPRRFVTVAMSLSFCPCYFIPFFVVINVWLSLPMLASFSLVAVNYLTKFRFLCC